MERCASGGARKSRSFHSKWKIRTWRTTTMCREWASLLHWKGCESFSYMPNVREMALSQDEEIASHFPFGNLTILYEKPVVSINIDGCVVVQDHKSELEEGLIQLIEYCFDTVRNKSPNVVCSTPHIFNRSLFKFYRCQIAIYAIIIIHITICIIVEDVFFSFHGLTDAVLHIHERSRTWHEFIKKKTSGTYCKYDI